MRIVMLGANGQVASEIALMLLDAPGVDLRCVARSRGGSAFLRLNGVPVHHGDVSVAAQAGEMFEGADVVANFALALGPPAQALAANREIIRQVFECSPPGATVVFFSTLAVHGEYDWSGARKKSFYGHMKLRNERQVLELAGKLGRKVYVLRLGHVCGAYQNIRRNIAQDIANSPVALPDPDRQSNTTNTAMIAEALVAIGARRAGAPGLYDLVNQPQWTWRQVYEHEARLTGKAVELLPAAPPAAPPSLRRRVLSTLAGAQLRQTALKVMARLPGRMAASLKAEHSVLRVQAELAELGGQAVSINSAALWPALAVKPLPGLPLRRLWWCCLQI